MTNPTPVAWISEGGDVSRSFLYFEQMGFKNSHPLYTEAQLNQARADALREAADEIARLHLTTIRKDPPVNILMRLAAEIEGEKGWTLLNDCEIRKGMTFL